MMTTIKSHHYWNTILLEGQFCEGYLRFYRQAQA